MKERGMLFSAPMVRALLDGSKTQTRRVCKLPANAQQVQYWTPPSGKSQPGWADPGVNYWTPDQEGENLSNHLDPCPYGKVGDRIWVRENFQPFINEELDGDFSRCNWKTGEGYHCTYPATDGVFEFMDADDNLRDAIKPSIHMPRWASRIDLEITGVRVERLQDISEADAIAEGVNQAIKDMVGDPPDSGYESALILNPRFAYETLWESLAGAGSWDANPWVWVIEFRRVKP